MLQAHSHANHLKMPRRARLYCVHCDAIEMTVLTHAFTHMHNPDAMSIPDGCPTCCIGFSRCYSGAAASAAQREAAKAIFFKKKAMGPVPEWEFYLEFGGVGGVGGATLLNIITDCSERSDFPTPRGEQGSSSASVRQLGNLVEMRGPKKSRNLQKHFN
jgi:hypothetical protein